MKFSNIAMLSTAAASTYAFTFPQAPTALLPAVALSISIFHASTVSAFAIPNARDLRAIMPDNILKRATPSNTTTQPNKDEEHKKKHHHKSKKPSDQPVASITKKDVAATASDAHTHTHTHDLQATPEPTAASKKHHSGTGTHHHENHHHKTTAGSAGVGANPSSSPSLSLNPIHSA